MPVYLGHEEFPDEILTVSDRDALRMLLDRARGRRDQSAKALLDGWTEELKRKRRELRRRRES
jgi:hypothetical protein